MKKVLFIILTVLGCIIYPLDILVIIYFLLQAILCVSLSLLIIAYPILILCAIIDWSIPSLNKIKVRDKGILDHIADFAYWCHTGNILQKFGEYV